MTIVNWTNVTDFGQIPSQANVASGGSFWVAMLYMVWIILIFVLIYTGLEAALLVSSFIALIIGLVLVYADLIAWTWVLTFLGVILSIFLYIIWSSPKTRA